MPVGMAIEEQGERSRLQESTCDYTSVSILGCCLPSIRHCTQAPAQHARMNVQLQYLVMSHRVPGHAGTHEQPVIVPNDEPSSQGYRESCIHSACAEDAVHQLPIPCSLSIMPRSRRSSGSREALDGTTSRLFFFRTMRPASSSGFSHGPTQLAPGCYQELTSCNVWLRLVWEAHRQTTRQSKRRSLVAALTTTDVLQCMVQTRLEGASSNNSSRVLLLRGDVLFTLAIPRPVIAFPLIRIEQTDLAVKLEKPFRLEDCRSKESIVGIGGRKGKPRMTGARKWDQPSSCCSGMKSGTIREAQA
ncbi:uncharacterized protein BDR25DRAFT_361872 [Lindgomyces ingoldianus]|uniref:Uncharacterized protein n=1 Tax=Lindgomyces ingoldianus TaxID=673940 RepID=A0ACB6QDD5_9PLEO|nr:uncharacterized protein BDR25DRAFT_361872 [Lindgomyces ingoldianus]KAF2464137.1 hypothetical protein BDR25DRAFT_361872 [Lindgomyces ingoldianus]